MKNEKNVAVARRLALGLLLSLLLVATLGAGYWWGQETRSENAADVRPVLAANKPRVPLYYRNPMGLADTSPVPKKDEMGMDYIPVYAEDSGEATNEGDEAERTLLRLTPGRVQALGVRTATVQRQVLDQVVRAAGRVEVDEGRVEVVAPRFEGWIERLHVATTGQRVRRGQPLFEVYGPELVSAQRDDAIAREALAGMQGSSAEARSDMQRLAEASRARLQNWGIDRAPGGQPAKGGSSSGTTLILRAPRDGYVIEKKAVQGMRFQAGEPLFRIADLSTVWVIAEVFERDLARLAVGQKAVVTSVAWPGESFEARLAYIYPELDARSRTVPVRLALANPQGRLKPAMFVEVTLSGDQTPRLVVPDSAVLRSGTRELVLVQSAPGRFRPRPVRLGQQGEHWVEVLDGLQEGEQVVTAANFLLDSQSNLQAALAGMSGPEAAAATSAAHEPAGHQHAAPLPAAAAVHGHDSHDSHDSHGNHSNHSNHGGH